MNKSLYIFGIFFIGLSVVCGVLSGIIYLLIGAHIYTQKSFIEWFFVGNIISLIASVFLLKYYHYRKFRFAFSAGMVSAIANLCFCVVIYKILASRELLSYYTPVRLICLCTGIVYALSLIFSGTGKKSWLKMAGVCTLVVTLILLFTTLWILSAHPVRIYSTLETIEEWASMAGSLAPVLYIMHFLAELKLLKKENADISTPEWLKNILGAGGMIAFIFTITFGIMIASECSSQLYWGKQNFENTKKWARLFEARMFVNSKGDTLFYRLLKPLNYDPQKKYPLVVSLPYGGQPGTDKIRQVEGAVAAEVLSTDFYRSTYPSFLFVPNCPPGSGWGGIPNYPSVDSLVYKAIDALEKELPIDVKRCYVTGISRGGFGSWNFICTQPDMFAAAIPVSSGGDPKLAPKIVKVSVWAFHGAKDMNVPVSGSRDMINAIKKAGGNPRYTEYPDGDHNIWYQVSNTPGLWGWLFAQKRD